jgi:hypothetical protein
MGEMIAANAAVDRVEEYVRESLANGRAAGGEIKAAAEARLAGVVARLDGAKATLKAAAAAEGEAYLPVSAADDAADLIIGAVRDKMWNAIGRVKQHPAMDEVFPGGVGTYAHGDPRTQPVLMTILISRIAAVDAPAAWSAERRQGWAAEVEAARLPLVAALDAYTPMEAALTVAEATFRTRVRAAHSQLVKLKRDLKNHGLTETKIHQIIPDAKSARRKASKAAPVATPEPAE